MSNIFSVKYMNEATASLANKVLKTPVNETYLYSTLKTLQEMNNEINEATKNLYILISEAESKDAENKIFAEYFYQFKNTFQNFRNKVDEMKSRLIINVENKVDTWKDVLKDDCSFDKEFSYSGYKFYHIEDCDYPRFNLHKLYQKEFDYIGQLMQDKNIESSPSARLKIIASVSNNFINYSANKNWIKDMIRNMVDVDNKEIHGSYSECIYNSLRDKYDFNVDKGVLYTCKENLCDYEDVLNANIKLCDDLLRDLDKVGENIASYLFRNQDKKLKIKTDKDGVIDRDYRLDTYSMNELDLFMKNKVNQVKKVLNIYAIAIGIKFDTVVEYFDQNIDILRMAIMNDSELVEDDSDYEDNWDNSSEDPEFADNGMSDDGDESFEEEPEDDFDIDFGEETDEEVPVDDDGESEPIDGDSQEFEEAYLFEAELFELQSMMEAQELYNYIMELTVDEAKKKVEDAKNRLNSIKEKQKDPKENVKPEHIKRFEKKLNEAEENLKKAEAEEKSKTAIKPDKTQTGTTSGSQTQSTTSGSQTQSTTSGSQDNTTNTDKQPDNQELRKLAAKRKENLWTKLMAKLAELWKKFKDKVFGEKTKAKCAYVAKHKDEMLTAITGEKVGLKYTPKLQLLDKFNIPDFNYAGMRNSLTDDQTFVSVYFKDWSEKFNGGDSISDIIKELVLGEEQSLQDISTIKCEPGKINEVAFDFCSNYNVKYKSLEKQADILNRAQQAARKLENVTESSYSNDFNQYFTEMETENEQKRTNVDVYFRICSRVLTAQMTVYEKLFKELYEYCKWHISKVSEKKSTGANPSDGQATKSAEPAGIPTLDTTS